MARYVVEKSSGNNIGKGDCLKRRNIVLNFLFVKPKGRSGDISRGVSRASFCFLLMPVVSVWCLRVTVDCIIKLSKNPVHRTFAFAQFWELECACNIFDSLS